MVTYQFEALPHVLQAAIPRTYAGPLFEKSRNDEASQSEKEDTSNDASQQPSTSSAGEQPRSREQLNTLIEHGRKVTVVGVTIDLDKKRTYILAGTTSKTSTGENRRVAICIDDNTTLLKRTGELAVAVEVEHLQENVEIVVEGKKSKRSVIHATHVVV